MDWYYYIAWAAIVSQFVFLIQMLKNYRYALSKYKKERTWYRPKTVLIVPCKGIDSAFDANITSFFNQDYENYSLWFVVAEESDPAYDKLCKLKESLSQATKAKDVQILIAGQGQLCSQKIHNLLHCCGKISGDVEILAFADSDACIHPDWLSHIVYPLRKSENGAASGYRWFVPERNNLATLVLSAVNAKIAQLLGDTIFNQAWGGSMAIRLKDFRRLGIDKIWAQTLSDDLSLSRAVKKAGMRVNYVPACLVASYEAVSWKELFEFGRRQFLITRVSAPGTWWFGLSGCIYSILGLWGGAAMAVYTGMVGSKNLALFGFVPILFFTSQLTRAIFRQKMAAKLFEKDRSSMKAAAIADILLFWFWSLLLLIFIISSAFGRTITWRGIRYKLRSPTEIIVVSR
jgi:cellulose synthase/poly-beta-1,6-N-acetylglucosamine synthase-like glycosyltransferase